MTSDGPRSFEAPATPDCLGEAHDLISEVAEDAGLSDEVVIRFESAAMEVVANVIEHGARDDAVRLSLSVGVADGWIRGEVRDDGAPVPVDLELVEMPEEMAESGRGIAIALALLDEFSYERSDQFSAWHLGVQLDG